MGTMTYRARAFLEAAERVGCALVVGTDREQALAPLHPEAHLTLDFGDPEGAARRAAELAARHLEAQSSP